MGRHFRRIAVLTLVGLSFGPVLARADLFGVGGSPATQSFPTLLRFSPQGQALGPFPAVNPPKSEEFNSLTRGPDGNLYFLGNVLGGGSILKATTTGAGSVTSLYQVSGGLENWNLVAPLGIGFDSAGRLYVTSNTLQLGPGAPTGTTKVYRYDGPNTLTPVYSPPSTSQLLADVEFDAADAMYVGINGVGIRKIDSGGVMQFTIATTSVRDFKFGPDGKLYVASGPAGVLRYDPSNGAALGALVAPGTGGLMDATYMTFGDDGTLYVNDRTAGVILKYDPLTGAPRGVFTAYPSAPGSFEGPYSIAFVNVPEPGGALLAGAAAAAAATFVSGRRGRRSRRVPRGRPAAG
jgi:hypothetical protein